METTTGRGRSTSGISRGWHRKQAWKPDHNEHDMMCLRLLPFCVRLGECKTTACIAFWASSCRHLRHHAYADTKKFPRKDFPAYSIRALIDCHSRSIDRLNCFRFCAAILYDVLVFYLSVFRDGTGDCLSFILFFSYDCDFLYFFFSVWFFFLYPS